jgi:hypothetical protein
MDEELKQALAGLEARIEARIGEQETRLLERIQDTETKLLTGFYDWARPVETRVNKQLPAIDERLGWLEARVAQLERKNIERGI